MRRNLYEDRNQQKRENQQNRQHRKNQRSQQNQQRRRKAVKAGVGLAVLAVILLLGGCGTSRGAILPVLPEEGTLGAGEKAKAEEAGVSESGADNPEADTQGAISGTGAAAAEGVGSQASVDEAANGANRESMYEKTYVTVHVCGAVRNPGVYELEAGSRLMEAVQAAGGVLEDGAGDYLNLAATVFDGEKIIVPFLDEVDSPFGETVYGQPGGNVPGGQPGGNMLGGQQGGNASGEQQGTGQQDTAGKVDINTADENLLQTLPGIGASKAAAIVEYREKNGSFSSIEEIKNVPGIKDGAYGKIKDYIIVQ